MTQTVIVPGVGTLQFPDGMSQTEMAAAIRKNFPEIHPRQSPMALKKAQASDDGPWNDYAATATTDDGPWNDYAQSKPRRSPMAIKAQMQPAVGSAAPDAAGLNAERDQSWAEKLGVTPKQWGQAVRALGHGLASIPRTIVQHGENASASLSQFYPDWAISPSIKKQLMTEAQQYNAVHNAREAAYQRDTPWSPTVAIGAGIGNVVPWLFGSGEFRAAKSLPVAGNMLSRMGTGVVRGLGIGALSPTTDPDYWHGVRSNMLAGATVGGLLPIPAAAASRLARGLATPTARSLMNEGVRLTPGQMLGGGFKTAEDKLTSIPLAGVAIRNAQQRSVEDFSRAAVNRALQPLGKSLPDNVKAGRFALDYAQQVVSSQYDKALGQMSATADGPFLQSVASVWSKYAPKLVGDKSEELRTFIREGVFGKMSPGAPIAGRVLHDIQSDLGQQASRLMKSELQSNRVLGQAVKDLQGHVRSMLERQNPARLTDAYKDATAAYKNLVRVQRAASLAGSKEGIITPNTLRQAVRATDSTRNKMAYSQGRAPLQDLAEAGMDTIPSKIADSGTAGRLAVVRPNLTEAAVMLPATAIAHALYSRPALAAMAALLAPAPSAGNALVSGLAQRMLGTPANALLVRPTAQQLP